MLTGSSSYLGRAQNALKTWLVLRAFEFILAVVVVSILTLVVGDGVSFDEAEVDWVEEIPNLLVFWGGFAGVYVIFTGYALISLVVFVSAGILVGITVKNVPFLNALPYAMHSFPFLMGWFGGEPAGLVLWTAWLIIVCLDAISPYWLTRLWVQTQPHA